MNVINQTVMHKSFGKGVVIEEDEKYFKVKFESKIVPFAKDNASKYITFDNDEAQSVITDAENKRLIAEEDKKRTAAYEEEKRRQASTLRSQPKKKVKKLPVRKNVIFKCNFCDGGACDSCVGFKGVCSNEQIKNNINIEGHTWCKNPKSPCKQYLLNKITRAELDNMHSKSFVCYESQMLTKWTAYAGENLTGPHKGEPKKLVHVQPNSLAVLSTRFPETEEIERIIFAVFLVDHTYEGDTSKAGYVSTTSKYKIALTEAEAKQIKFWHYYKNNDDTAFWGSNLHRYLSDAQAMQILKDIIDVKADASEKAFAREFLEEYARLTKNDINNISEPDGVI